MHRVLIANRAEIARRVTRACHSLGMEAVAVYSQADAGAPHTREADQAILIGGPKAADSYLKIDALLDAAKRSGADAIHPGYGFLAENAGFAEAVEAAGLTWIGPTPAQIRLMGDKGEARRIAAAAGVPINAGSRDFPVGDTDGLHQAAEAVGYPLLIKAAHGGGGIGMKKVVGPEQLEDTVTHTQKLAFDAFGDGTVFLEHFMFPARHIEVQVFGFGDGNAVHLYERECSVQRRYQKVIEESPAPGVPAEVIEAMTAAAVALARQIDYRGAGTVEFIMGPDGRFFFLEMNTRIQVEHPVTEMVTGVDLVGAQLRLARGDDLTVELAQERIRRTGAAVEVRLYAEKPEMNFVPFPGLLDPFGLPATAPPHLRVEAGYEPGQKMTPHYDPMLAKILTWDETRAAAIARMEAVLAGLDLGKVVTNRAYLRALLAHPGFQAGETRTDFVDLHKADLLAATKDLS